MKILNAFLVFPRRIICQNSGLFLTSAPYMLGRDNKLLFLVRWFCLKLIHVLSVCPTFINTETESLNLKLNYASFEEMVSLISMKIVPTPKHQVMRTYRAMKAKLNFS